MRDSITKKNVKTDSQFEDVGLMLDLSRGKVLNVATVKKVIDEASCFGFTYINLYLEDLLTLDGYPQYGYMRGRYSDDEITEIVTHAKQKRMDIYPAIQTLGHLEHFLRWSNSNQIKDTGSVLNVTVEESYVFIEELVIKCKELFGGNKINIGMDEAFDLGHGKVFRDGNQLSQKELYLNHLKRVTEICKTQGYEIIKIWSDMLFSTYSNSNGESLYSTNFQAEIENLDSALELIFWNYWTENQDTYENILTAHFQFSNNVSMALGIHTWGLPFYNLNQLPITKSALQACRKKGVKDILFTMWGDDGALYNLDSVSLGMYETMAYILNHPTNSSEFLRITGKNYDECTKICKILDIGINPLHVIWNDPITNIYLKTLEDEQLQDILKKSTQMSIADNSETAIIYNLYIECVKNDINLYFDNITLDLITKASNDLSMLYNLIVKCWIREAKPNGLEEVQLRFESKLKRYTFLYENKNHCDIQAIRKEKVEDIKWMKKTYNNISKATKYRWD